MKPAFLARALFTIIIIFTGACIPGIDFNSQHSRFKHSTQYSTYYENINTNASQSFCFGVIGDTHIGKDGSTEILSSALSDFSSRSCSFFSILGDLTDNGSESEFQTIQDLMVQNNVNSFRPVVGNHDLFDKGWRHFKERFKTAFYSFTVNDTFFLIIDNANSTMDKTAYSWIEEQLGSSSETVKIVFMHVPVYLKTFTSLFEFSNTLETIQFIYIMEKYNVDMVFAGHFHYYSTNSFRGVEYVISGGGNRGLDSSATPHYLVVTVENNAISINKIDL